MKLVGFVWLNKLKQIRLLLSVSNWRNSSLELWIWGNSLDFIECEIVRVWEGLREQAKNRETETKEMKTEEMRKSEKGRRRREWEAMSIRGVGVCLWSYKLKSEDQTDTWEISYPSHLIPTVRFPFHLRL